MSNMKITVLGAGLVGFPMALDLSKDENFSVTICDIRKERLDWINKKYGIKTIQADLSDADTVRKIVRNTDFVVSAVPGFLGLSDSQADNRRRKECRRYSFLPGRPI